MRVGWLHDCPERFAGGAELEVDVLLETVPKGIDIIFCPPERIEADVDVYVIHNCMSYDRSLLRLLEGKPVVKRVHDLWLHGDAELRRWLLRHSDLLLLSSPLQREEMPWQINAPVVYVPSPVKSDTFHQARLVNTKRSGTVWLGRLVEGKGLECAHSWAVENGQVVDVYGFGPLQDSIHPPLTYCGAVTYLAVPRLLSRYERFLFLPDAVEPFGRTVIEAWMAGCELVVNGNIGALWWLKHEPATLSRAEDHFWQLVERAAQ